MLLKPDIKLKKITDITPAFLKSRGITDLILDVDNTLSVHHGQMPTPGLEAWLNTMRESGIGLIILSNSKEERVKPFAGGLGLEFVSLGLKPLPFKFKRALEMLNSDKSHTAIVGDQIFTDVLGGSLYGVKTVLLDPIEPEKALRFRIKRRAERLVFKIYRIKNTEV